MITTQEAIKDQNVRELLILIAIAFEEIKVSGVTTSPVGIGTAKKIQAWMNEHCPDMMNGQINLFK